MEKLFVALDAVYSAKTGGGTIAGIDELDLLATGAIAVFDASNNLLTAATVAADVADISRFWFAIGNQTYSTFKSDMIDRDAYDYSKSTYVAPVKKVMQIQDLDTLFTATAGEVVTIKISRSQIASEDSANLNEFVNIYPGVDSINVNYLVSTGQTKQQVIDAITAEINAKAGAFVTASNDTPVTYIQFAANDYLQDFTVQTDDLMSTLRATETVALVLGEGYGPTLRAYEDWLVTADGRGNRVMYPTKFYNVPRFVDLTETYNVYSWSWISEHRKSVGIRGQNDNCTQLAVPSGADTLLGVLDSIFAAVDLEDTATAGIVAD